MSQRAERNHLVVLAAHIEIQEIVRLQSKLRVGLHIDLKYLPEFVELIDVGRTQKRGQGREHIPDRYAKGLGPVAVHRHRHLWRARAECRQHVLQLGIIIGLLDDLIGEFAQPLKVIAAAEQLYLHLQPASITDALDGRWRHYGKPAIRRRAQSFLQPLGVGQDVRSRRLAPLIPGLQDDEADTGISEVGEIVERRQARYRDHRVHARRGVAYCGRLVERAGRAAEYRAVGQLRDDQQVTLIFIRDESRR